MRKILFSLLLIPILSACYEYPQESMYGVKLPIGTTRITETDKYIIKQEIVGNNSYGPVWSLVEFKKKIEVSERDSTIRKENGL